MCFFLYGNCNLKTNKAGLSRDKNHNVESFRFSKEDIVNIEIRENLSSKSSEQLWNDFSSLAHIGSGSPGLNTTYTATKQQIFIKSIILNFS